MWYFEGIKRDIKRIKRDIGGFGRKKGYIKRLKGFGENIERLKWLEEVLVIRRSKGIKRVSEGFGMI